MIFSRTAAITIAAFLVGTNAQENKDEVLKRALADAGIGAAAAADVLGFSAAAYKGYGAELLGDHLAAATASDGIDAGLPFGLAEGGIHRDAGASILKRDTSSTGTKEAEVFKRFLSEAGYNPDGANILNQIVETVKRDDEDSAIMRRQIVTAFGEDAAAKMLAGVSKREELPAANNRVAMVKRALISAGIHGDADLDVLGAKASAQAGIDGEVLGDHLAAAAASADVGADVPGIASGNIGGDAGAAILKRALISAAIGGDANVDILGAKASAQAGLEGEVLGDHLAAAAASADIGADVPGIASGDIGADAAAAILKRALADAGIGAAAAADVLGFSAAAYKGYGAELLGDHLAAATASDGIDAGLPFGLAEGGIHRDAGASILKRALADAGIGAAAAADVLGFSAAAYKGYGAELLGDHLAAATASDGIDAGLPFGLAEGGIHRDAGASILKRALIEAGIHGDANLDVLGAKASAQAGIDGEVLGDHLAAAAASADVGADVPGIASGNIGGDAGAAILKRALISAAIGGDANVDILGAKASAQAGLEGEVLGDHLAAAAASADIGANVPGIASGDIGADAAAAILKRALADAGIGAAAAADVLGFSAAAYKGYGAELLGDHLAAATASDGIDAGLPFGLAEGGIHRDAGASILKRALVEAGIHGDANLDVLGAKASAQAGIDGEVLGNHLAAAAASAAIGADVPGVASGDAAADAAAAIL